MAYWHARRVPLNASRDATCWANQHIGATQTHYTHCLSLRWSTCKRIQNKRMGMRQTHWHARTVPLNAGGDATCQGHKLLHQEQRTGTLHIDTPCLSPTLSINSDGAPAESKRLAIGGNSQQSRGTAGRAAGSAHACRSPPSRASNAVCVRMCACVCMCLSACVCVQSCAILCM